MMIMIIMMIVNSSTHHHDPHPPLPPHHQILLLELTAATNHKHAQARRGATGNERHVDSSAGSAQLSSTSAGAQPSGMSVAAAAYTLTSRGSASSAIPHVALAPRTEGFLASVAAPADFNLLDAGFAPVMRLPQGDAAARVHVQTGQHHAAFNAVPQLHAASSTGAQLQWLQQDARECAEEKLSYCNQCGYCTSNRSHMAQHMRTHTREAPFKCEHCDYRAIQRSHLTQHSRTHSGERPYECERCDYRTISMSNLKRHERLHDEQHEKPFVCEVCA